MPPSPSGRGPNAMANIWGLGLMLFLIAHALVGVMMFAARPKQAAPSWPTGKSWLFGFMGMSEGGQRRAATVLMAIAALFLIGGAVGIVGVPAIVSIWPSLVVVGAIVSALTLVLYFSPWWLGGIAINLGLIVAIVVFKWPTNEALGL